VLSKAVRNKSLKKKSPAKVNTNRIDCLLSKMTIPRQAEFVRPDRSGEERNSNLSISQSGSQNCFARELQETILGRILVDSCLVKMSPEAWVDDED